MNPCDEHKNFVGDVCPVCLMRENEQLKDIVYQCAQSKAKAEEERDALVELIKDLDKCNSESLGNACGAWTYGSHLQKRITKILGGE